MTPVHSAVNFPILKGDYELPETKPGGFTEVPSHEIFPVHAVNTTERKFRQLWHSRVEQRIRAEACSLDEQVGPKEVKFCVRCVVSNQRPRIVFNEDGVCSACLYAERKKAGIDWRERAHELRTILHQHRKPAGYDVIVPCSGGKDSTFVAHTLKHEHGMNPLCVKFAPFIYTDIGRKNFESFIQSGFDCLVAWPNGIIHRKLARLSFEYLGDPFQPFVFGQLCYPMQMSRRFQIPLVFFGENGEAEYGGDPAADDKPCWSKEDWDRIYLKGAGVKRLVDLGIGLGALSSKEVREISEFYSLPPEGTTESSEFHWLGYYKKWHPQSNYYLAAANAGFEANPEGRSEGTYSKYASLDDRTDGFHYFMAYIKFGMGRATSDAAHETRDGDITRDEAKALVKRYDGEFPRKHFQEFLDYIGCDEKHFWKVADRFRPEHLWEQKEGVYWLRHGVADAGEKTHSAA